MSRSTAQTRVTPDLGVWSQQPAPAFHLFDSFPVKKNFQVSIRENDVADVRGQRRGHLLAFAVAGPVLCTAGWAAIAERDVTSNYQMRLG